MTVEPEMQDGGAPHWRLLGLAVLILLLTMLVLAALWQVPRLLPGPFEQWSAAVRDATPTPAVLEPTITGLYADVDDQARTITFHLAAEVPPDRQVSEVLLWYDTELGNRAERVAVPLIHTISISYRLEALL